MYHRASSVINMYSYNLSQFMLKLSSFIPTTRCHDVSFFCFHVSPCITFNINHCIYPIPMQHMMFQRMCKPIVNDWWWLLERFCHASGWAEMVVVSISMICHLIRFDLHTWNRRNGKWLKTYNYCGILQYIPYMTRFYTWLYI